jgi:hypothetical protein
MRNKNKPKKMGSIQELMSRGVMSSLWPSTPLYAKDIRSKTIDGKNNFYKKLKRG